MFALFYLITITFGRGFIQQDLIEDMQIYILLHHENMPM